MISIPLTGIYSAHSVDTVWTQCSSIAYAYDNSFVTQNTNNRTRFVEARVASIFNFFLSFFLSRKIYEKQQNTVRSICYDRGFWFFLWFWSITTGALQKIRKFKKNSKILKNNKIYRNNKEGTISTLFRYRKALSLKKINLSYIQMLTQRSLRAN